MKNPNERLIDQEISWRMLALNKKRDNCHEELEKAQKICADLMRDNPANPDVLFVRGIIDFNLGMTKDAEACMDKALTIAPHSTVVLFIYGIILMIQKKYNAALLLLMRVVTLKPDHAEAHWFISSALIKTGALAGALASINKAVEIDPQNAEALSDRGNILKILDRLPEAAACYEKALALKADDHRFINNLGVIHFLQNDLDGAEALYLAALASHPAYPEALNNMGALRLVNGDFDDAILYCRRALALRQDYPEALNNLGNALKDARRFEEAITAYKESLRLDPDDADVHKNLALALLALGRFEEGWHAYEWRWKSKQLRHAFRDFAKPEWQGEDGEGRTILIHAEQGLGDTLQFCRYAPFVKERGFHVLMEVPLPLKRIIQSLDGVDKVVTKGDALPHFDLHCPMMHLPLAFHTTARSIPGKLPYLKPNPVDLTKWRDRVTGLANDAFKVGLVWAGNSRVHLNSTDLIATDRKRSLAPEVLAPLMDLTDVQFFSLQKEGSRAPDIFQLIDWMEDCHDLADTAALIMNLDLVISVDTAVAHLAGALGKPVWLLNRFNSCWRWLVGRDNSPWYPGILRIFHQKEMGNWDDVIMRVRVALAEGR